MTTINELINKYDANINLEKQILSYPVDFPLTDFKEYHTENRDGKTIHVFSGEQDSTTFEYIIDTNKDTTSITYLSNNKDYPEEPSGYSRVIWDADGTIHEEIA